MEVVVGTKTAILKIANWEECRYIGKNMARWLFRGQSKSEWSLKSSVERALESREISISMHSGFEMLVLSEFQSVAHNLYNFTPTDDDIVGWLSLIQHYGGPTRLLDITESFYIASHFALEGALDECAIWAINRPELIKLLPNAINELAMKIGKRDYDIKDKISAIIRASIATDIRANMVLTASPAKKSERQFTQKGLSLIPLNIQEGYMQSLLGSFEDDCKMPNSDNFEKIDLKDVPQLIKTSNIVKINVPKSCFLDARLDLNSMNINSFSLFGGLDGLGKHLSDVLNSVELYEKLKRGNQS